MVEPATESSPGKPPRIATGEPPVIVDRGPLSSSFETPDGVSLDQSQQDQLARFRDLLLGWNERINLTAIKEPEDVERRLFLDALRMVPAILASVPDGRTASLIDIGSGAGFPGLPLAIAMPQLDFTLLDSTNKKLTFIAAVAAELGLENVQTLHGRAEEIGHNFVYRARFDLATARAVASLPTLVELATPLLREGGRAFFPKSADIETELAEGKRACAMLGAQFISSNLLSDGTDELVTRLVIMDKLGSTPMRFPRRAGLPAKEPLGRAKTS
jgi:16S rRNA (guanine527-N7)-methyltransferase